MTHDVSQPPTGPIRLSVVIPMFNEEENIQETVDRVAATLADFNDGPWEILLINDGSLDQTDARARALAARPEYAWLRVVSYAPNRGRGYALRRGFAAAQGEWIVSIDADLSYEPHYILDLLKVLRDQPDVDFVLASAYMPGGGVENVPLNRALASRFGNHVLSFFMSSSRQKVHTITCVFRAYRRHVLDSLDLESDDKDIHLEILSKAMMLGFRFVEVPAILRGRRRGYSKFRFRGTATSHLIFALFERPIVAFSIVGVLMLSMSMALIGWSVYQGILKTAAWINWYRPILMFTMVAFIGGIQLISFGIIGTQIVNLRKEIIKLQARMREKPDRRPPKSESDSKSE